jgi:heme oxygenase (mycobilin-producing)
MNPDIVQPAGAQVLATTPPRPGEFVAVNFISCQDSYRERFEQLFRSRAHAIDRVPGFRHMVVLRPERAGGDYLVVSFWLDRGAFDAWRKAPEFAEGHRRGFEDVRQAREQVGQPPMTSRMETYEILTD